ncbi:WD40/YVTN/BNR-like repeat-containing protein [Longimicrobium sp.]|uniref:WD40/YVTN/BNR-like repeat-containing protein n=1 Tax=Longimicrobium sp. TaxID=2029185 RepID=UPI003B3ADF6B
MHPLRSALVALALLAAPSLAAQVERNTPPEADSVRYRGLAWRNLGPNRGGRSIAVAGSTARPQEYYFGATGGGLWKTTDGGTTWQPTTDGRIGTSSVGAVEVCQSNPDVLYMGTGESQLRGNIQAGDGVYKSVDAGKTWTHVGLREARNVGRVRIHPTNCDVAYAAAFGHYSEANPERGIYRTTDGGQTWTQVLKRDEKTGGVDISIDPQNPDIVYAALWEAWRNQWAMSSGGPGSGLFRSNDGGATWTELTRRPGLPQQGLVGKIGVSVSPADPTRVYAIVEHDSGGVFRSDDRGDTWERVNTERKLRQRAFYYTRLLADPKEKDRVYVLNVGFYRSDDGGKTFPTAIRVPHGDNHDLWIAADDNQRMVQGNDGGGNVSVNGGKSWTDQDYPTAQIYRLALTHHQPAMACGGQQDNTTVCVPVRGWGHLNAGGRNFFAVGGCESGYVAPHPSNTDVYYAGCYGGALDRFDYSTGQNRPVNVWPENPMGQSASDVRERTQWTFPILFDPMDPAVLYTATQHLWKSTNEGQSWQRISPDLTRADPATLGPSGGPITRDQTGVETYATIFAVGPSPRERGLIWTGSDDGRVHVTRDGGGSWTDITPPALPEHTKIFTVEASPHRPGTAYVAGNRYLLDDFRPYLFRTDDYGRTWTNVGGNLPEGENLRSVREDPVRPRMLYAATERGVWVSWDDGGSWESIRLNLPVVQVSDLAVRDADIVISTHGRSFYALDYGAHLLRQMRDVPAQPDAPARTRNRAAGTPPRLYQPADVARGVDNGVTVYYQLPAAARRLTVDFLDAQGNVIRSFANDTRPDSVRNPRRAGGGGDDDDEGEGGGWGGAQRYAPNQPGMNRYSWNLRYPGPTSFPGMILWAASTEAGPRVVPGTYTVRLTVDGREQRQTFTVRTDPRLQGVSQADLQRRFDFAMQIRNRTSQANDAVLLIRGVRQQVQERLERTQDAEVRRAADSLLARIGVIEERLYQVRNQSSQDPLNYPIRLNNKLAALMGHVEEAESAPTEQSYQVFQELSGQLDRELAALEALWTTDLEALNRLLRAKRLPPVTRTPLQVDTDGPGNGREEETDEEEGEHRRW